MSTIGELLVLLGADPGPLAAGMAVGKREVKGFSDGVEKSSGSASRAMGMAGLAIVGGAVAIGAASIASAAKFQASMTLIQTQAGGTTAEVAAMTQGVLALAPTVGVGPEALAAGLYHVESAGIRGAAALDLLKTAAEGAKVGHADLESVTNSLIAAVNSGIKGTTSMSGAMGTLNAIVGSGNMRMSDLTDAFGTGILSAAKVFGVSIQSVGAALADMTNQGIPAVDAATRITSAIRLMAAPTHAAVKQLASIGLTSTALALDLRSPGGILTAIQDLKKHLEASGLSAVQQAALLAHSFGGKQSLGILTLIGNVDKLKTATDAVAKGAGTFGAAWTATEATTAAQGDRLKASFESITVAIGTGLLPAANSVLDVITPVVVGMAQWTAANPHLAATALAVAGAVGAVAAMGVVLGPILGGIATVIGIITSPIVLVVGALLALAAHFGLLGTGAKDAFDGIVSTISGAIPGIIAKVTEMAQAFVDWVGPMIPQVLAALGNFAAQAIGWIAAQAPAIETQLLAWASAFIGWVGDALPPLLGKLGQLGSSLIDWIIKEAPIAAMALADLAIRFVAWVLPMIPPLLGKLLELGVALVGWIIGEIPKIATALVQWEYQVGQWVINAIPGLIANLGQFFANLQAWVAQQEANIYQSFLSFGGQIVKGIMDAIGSIGKLVGDKLNEIPGVSIVGGVISFGVSVASNTVGGVAQLGANAAGALSGGSKPPPAQALYRYALGGIVPGSGPQLAIVHGGETIIPPGAGGLPPGTLQPPRGVVSTLGTGGARAGTSGGGPALTAALVAFTAALTRAISAGIPITLDYHNIGSLLDQGQYATASRVSSGFVTTGGSNG